MFGQETVYWLAGLTFTFALFFAMARFENLGTVRPGADIEEMRVISLPVEPPPPQPQPTETIQAPDVTPLTGIDAGSSDSPVKIAVVPPDLEALMPNTRMPSAKVEVGRLYTNLKPKADIDGDVRRVYQESEVDQPPRAMIRVGAPVTAGQFGDEKVLRVTLLLVIDVTGHAESVRILKSSGKAGFDEIVARTVKDAWVFSPALRRGKKVRCLAQQAFRMTFAGGGSPFTLE